MKNKVFRTKDGMMFYQHYNTSDFFDIKEFRLKDDGKWKDIIGTTGQNAERTAKSKAIQVFNYLMWRMIVEMIDRKAIIPFAFYKMGYLAVHIEESEKLSPETFNKFATVTVRFSHEYHIRIKKYYKARLTRRGRLLLLNSVKVKKGGTKRKY